MNFFPSPSVSTCVKSWIATCSSFLAEGGYRKTLSMFDDFEVDKEYYPNIE